MCQKEIVAEDILYRSDELNDFKGGMVENYVCLSLIANGYQTYYWQSERGAEVDFIIQRKGRVIPIEVKSADNTKAKSLNEYIKTISRIMLLNFPLKILALRMEKDSASLCSILYLIRNVLRNYKGSQP